MFVANIKMAQSAKDLKDRKCTKSLSDSAALAMIAMEMLEKDLNTQLKQKNEETFGLFAASPAPYSSDKSNYNDSGLRALKTDSQHPLPHFALNAQSASPNAGLIGLPNGVLNFGAKLLGARGPNSCHISGESSVHLALATMNRHMKLGRMESGVVTGYAKPSEVFSMREVDNVSDGGFAALIVADKEQLLSGPIAEILEISFSSAPNLLLHQIKPSDVDRVTVHGSPEQHVGAICDRLKSEFENVVNINQTYGYAAEAFGLCEMIIAPAKKYGLIVNISMCDQVSFLLYKMVK